MINHTPGPWRVGDAGHTVFGPPNGNPSPESIALIKDTKNAHIIAAAPELLAALKACQVRVFMHENASPEYQQAAAAIRKVTGEPDR